MTRPFPVLILAVALAPCVLASPRSIVAKAGRYAGLPDGLAVAVAIEESGLDPLASSGTSRGIMQINREWEGYLADCYLSGGRKAFYVWSIEDNAALGCLYLADLIRRYHGVQLALIAYNWGPGNLDSGKPIPQKVLAYSWEILDRIGHKP